MKKETFKKIKFISLLLGFLFLPGTYLTGSIIYILFTTSTVLALLVMPLISERLLHIKIIKFLILFIGLTGIVNNIHMMVEMVIVALRRPNMFDPIIFIMGIGVLIVLGIMLRGIIDPKYLYGFWEKQPFNKVEKILFPNKFPFNIPYIFASFVSAAFLFYYMTGLLLEMNIGRPSSTSAVGLFFIPLYAFSFFLISFIIGLIAQFIVGKFVNERVIKLTTSRTIITIFFITITIASIAGGLSFKSYEDAQKPRVIFNSGKVNKVSDIRVQDMGQIEASLVLTVNNDEKKNVVKMMWNEKPLNFELKRGVNGLRVVDDNGKELISIDLNNCDYITRVYAVPIGTQESKAKGLAVLVHLRATSRRSVLLIYDSKATLLYQELLERKRTENVMKAVKDVANKEYLWLNATSPITYAIKLGNT